MKISLVMVLRNEAKTIAKAIQSALPIIDEAVIGIDDSTTDQTEAEVVRALGDLPYHLSKFKWQDDFAALRNKYIGKAKSEWVLILDGHEWLDQGSYEYLKELKSRIGTEKLGNLEIFDFEISIKTPDGGDTIMLQPRLFRRWSPSQKKKIGYSFAIHNTITQTENRIALPQVLIHHDQPLERLKARREQRSQMNIEGLKKKAQKGDTRSMFYLGNTYYELENYRRASEWYEKYLKTSTFQAERYQARLYLSICYQKMDRPELLEDTLIGCFKDDCQRNEHLIGLGDIAMGQKRYRKALQMFLLATEYKMPIQNFLNFEKNFYTWIPWYKVTQAYLQLEDVDGVLWACGQGKIRQPDNKVFYDIEKKVMERVRLSEKGKNGFIYVVSQLPTFILPLMRYLENKYVLRLEQKFNPDSARDANLIWCDWGDSNAIAVANYQTKAKKILRIHSYEAYVDFVNHIAFDRFDEIVFVANHTKEYLFNRLNLNGELDKKTIIIPNGVDLSKFSITEGKKVNNKIAWAGYLKTGKGANTILLIARHLPDFEFHVAGEFHEPDLEQFFRERKTDNIILKPWQNDLNEFYKDKSFILSTSIRESNHLTVMEGMAAGLKPLIYYWIGADQLYNKQWIWSDFNELESIIRNQDWQPEVYRSFIEKKYDRNESLERMETVVKNALGRNV